MVGASGGAEGREEEALLRAVRSRAEGGGRGGKRGCATCGLCQELQLSPRCRLLSSFAVWWACYYFMAVLGGSVAFYRFPREPTSAPEPYTLRDIGFEVLPEFCPKPIMHLNFQSMVLLFFYSYALVWAVQNRINGQGALLLTRFFLMSSLVFVTRTTVVGLTSLPQPNFGKHCTHAQTRVSSYFDAVRDVCGSFPPKACGDLIYSGHVACAFVALFIFDSLQAYPRLRSRSVLPASLPRFLFYILGILSAFSCLLCRSHYSVDVILGIYFSNFLSSFYLNRAEGLVRGGKLGTVIRFLEGWKCSCSVSNSKNSETIMPADAAISLINETSAEICDKVDKVTYNSYGSTSSA